MILDIDVHVAHRLAEPCDLLLQLEVADMVDQRVSDSHLATSDVLHFTRVAASEHIGERIWMRAEGEWRCDYSATVHIDREEPDLDQLKAVPPHQLPGDVVRFLLPSRYCPSDEFQTFVAAEFGKLSGGRQVAALSDWIGTAFSYVSGSSNTQTTALDTFVQRQGVCRDYAHVLVTLARASTIPARFVAVYAPNVRPQDFHAVAEVYLDGAWHLVDPTGMVSANEMARIGVGADASEVAFMNVFGRSEFVSQSVSVSQTA